MAIPSSSNGRKDKTNKGDIMRSGVCKMCTLYDGENCRTDEHDIVPISLVFQCGIADQLTEGEECDYRRKDDKAHND